MQSIWPLLRIPKVPTAHTREWFARATPSRTPSPAREMTKAKKSKAEGLCITCNVAANWSSRCYILWLYITVIYHGTTLPVICSSSISRYNTTMIQNHGGAVPWFWIYKIFETQVGSYSWSSLWLLEKCILPTSAVPLLVLSSPRK